MIFFSKKGVILRGVQLNIIFIYAYCNSLPAVVSFLYNLEACTRFVTLFNNHWPVSNLSLEMATIGSGFLEWHFSFFASCCSPRLLEASLPTLGLEFLCFGNNDDVQPLTWMPAGEVAILGALPTHCQPTTEEPRIYNCSVKTSENEVYGCTCEIVCGFYVMKSKNANSPLYVSTILGKGISTCKDAASCSRTSPARKSAASSFSVTSGASYSSSRSVELYAG